MRTKCLVGAKVLSRILSHPCSEYWFVYSACTWLQSLVVEVVSILILK